MAAPTPTIVNRRARHDYFIDESFECGIALAGRRGEIDPRRQGQPPRCLRPGRARRGVALRHAHRAVRLRPDRARARAHAGSCCCNRREIDELQEATTQKGATLVPAALLLQGPPGEDRARRRPGQAAPTTSARAWPNATPSAKPSGRSRASETDMKRRSSERRDEGRGAANGPGGRRRRSRQRARRTSGRQYLPGRVPRSRAATCPRRRRPHPQRDRRRDARTDPDGTRVERPGRPDRWLGPAGPPRRPGRRRHRRRPCSFPTTGLFFAGVDDAGARNRAVPGVQRLARRLLRRPIAAVSSASRRSRNTTSTRRSPRRAEP